MELLQAVVSRAEQTEPRINAFTDTYFEEALEQAAAAADAYAAGTARVLEGLPIAIKDEPAIAGRRTTQGSLLFADSVPDSTDPVPERVLAAGGIVHARTAAPEFSMAIVTWSFLHGITRNPWNLELTSGGSSGGSGASLAAGTSTLASGSDIAGSIRIPAALCGLVGFKPPYGRVPEYWPWNREPFNAAGPLARTVGDTILFQNVISGPLRGDLWSLPPYRIPTSFPPIDGMRVALSADLGFFVPDAETVAALAAAAGLLEHLGARVEPVDPGWQDRVKQVVLDHLRFQSGAVLQSDLPPGCEGELTPYVRDFLALPEVTTERWIAGWEYLDHMYRNLETRVFEAGYDVLVCPTLTTTEIPADLGHPDAGPPVGLDAQLDLAMTYPFNALGKLPVVSIPIGFSAGTGVPIGMQIVGPPDRDDVPFRVAAGMPLPPPLPLQRGAIAGIDDRA